MGIGVEPEVIATGGRPPNQTLDVWAVDWQATQNPQAMLKSRSTRIAAGVVPRLAGFQAWTDFGWRHGWRIQKNMLKGSWRVVNERRQGRLSGSRAECWRQFRERSPDAELRCKNLTIVIHGLGRASRSMLGMANSIAKSDQQTTVVTFQYASTRSRIAEHACALRQFVRHLPRDVPLRFVGHSLGNIVVRHALADWRRLGQQSEIRRVEKIVMLGPPNHGSRLAHQLAGRSLFRLVTGPSGLELGREWKEIEPRLELPACPFGIVAGRVSGNVVPNPFLKSENDFIVAVEETRLPGAADFLVIPALHAFIMDHPEARQAVDNFLAVGKFDAG